MIACGATPVAKPLVYYGALAAVLVVFSAACVLQGRAAEVAYGKKDPSQAVADETAGQCLPMMALSSHASASLGAAGIAVAAAFVLFRIFDIIKPPPAMQLQKLPAGWGILVDDLFAGAYAGLVMWGLGYFGVL